MKKLETENGTSYDFTERNISSALTALNTTDNTFAILEKDDGSIIQVANNGKRGFYVEILDATTKNRIHCNKNYSEIREVINLFIEFERNKEVIAPQKWTKTVMPLIYSPPKLFQQLYYLGWAFVVVSVLYFILTRDFDDNPFAKYLWISGMWLMIPLALIDAVNFIRLLRRKIFNADGMRSLALLIIVVLVTAVMIFK